MDRYAMMYGGIGPSIRSHHGCPGYQLSGPLLSAELSPTAAANAPGAESTNQFGEKMQTILNKNWKR